MTLTITCWADEDPAVRQTRSFDNLMAELDHRDANPPADDRWSVPDFEEPGTYLSHVDDWDDLLSCPTHPMPYADDGIDLPDSERDELDRVALVGDDGRDGHGELMEERAEPHTRKDAA